MELLKGNMTLRAIADKYGLSLAAVHRHKQHIPHQLAVSHGAEKVAKADSVIQRV
jgi:Trp operon repressor